VGLLFLSQEDSDSQITIVHLFIFAIITATATQKERKQRRIEIELFCYTQYPSHFSGLTMDQDIKGKCTNKNHFEALK
jgi:hypothetical protein